MREVAMIALLAIVLVGFPGVMAYALYRKH